MEAAGIAPAHSDLDQDSAYRAPLLFDDASQVRLNCPATNPARTDAAYKAQDRLRLALTPERNKHVRKSENASESQQGGLSRVVHVGVALIRLPQSDVGRGAGPRAVPCSTPGFG